MLPARLRLRTDRGVEAPLEEAENEDEEDRSNLLRMSLCAPELETRRTTGLRPGVVLRSGIAAAAEEEAAGAPRSENRVDRPRVERELSRNVHPKFSPLFLLPRFIFWLLAHRCLPLPLPLHPSPPLSHTFFPSM